VVGKPRTTIWKRSEKNIHSLKRVIGKDGEKISIPKTYLSIKMGKGAGTITCPRLNNPERVLKKHSNCCIIFSFDKKSLTK
jgi:hypothetical protein